MTAPPVFEPLDAVIDYIQNAASLLARIVVPREFDLLRDELTRISSDVGDPIQWNPDRGHHREDVLTWSRRSQKHAYHTTIAESLASLWYYYETGGDGPFE
jgi:hypothetical protein